MKLTVGLLKEISKGYDIPSLRLFLQDRNDNDVLDLINRNDFISTILWTREDIKAKIEELGYVATNENIDKVINSGYLKALEDIPNHCWNVIEFAVHDVLS